MRTVFEGSEYGLFPHLGREFTGHSGECGFAFVKSGTSALEAALVGTPFLITYKVSPISWCIGSVLIRSPMKGLVNLIAQEKIVPELFQSEAKPQLWLGWRWNIWRGRKSAQHALAAGRNTGAAKPALRFGSGGGNRERLFVRTEHAYENHPDPRLLLCLALSGMIAAIYSQTKRASSSLRESRFGITGWK